VRGALYGSRLFEQPEHRAIAEEIRAFAHGTVTLEIGIDHGMCLLDSARRSPDERWLGIELRRRRVEALAPYARCLPTPPGDPIVPELSNALVVRADARTVIASVLPAGSLRRVIVRFPTPAADPRHLLLTPETVSAIERALAPDGELYLATDVPGMDAWARELLAGWRFVSDGAIPSWAEAVLSRRERVCRRDGIPVYRLVRARPESRT
jgi:tRNA G46 methylase TrmB